MSEDDNKDLTVEQFLPLFSGYDWIEAEVIRSNLHTIRNASDQELTEAIKLIYNVGLNDGLDVYHHPELAEKYEKMLSEAKVEIKQ